MKEIGVGDGNIRKVYPVTKETGVGDGNVKKYDSKNEENTVVNEIIRNKDDRRKEIGVGDGFIGGQCSKAVGTDDYSEDNSIDDFSSDSFYDKLYPSTSNGNYERSLSIFSYKNY